MKSLTRQFPHPLFQGLERHQSHTAWRDRTPECEETAEEFEEVDVLCHHPTAGDSGGHCRRSHPAMEEGLAWLQTRRAWHGIYVVALFLFV